VFLSHDSWFLKCYSVRRCSERQHCSLLARHQPCKYISLEENWLLNQTVEHILSHYILLRGVPNLPQTDWAISIIWLRYIMPKKSTRCHRQSTALVSTWCQKQINHPQSCELVLVKFCKLSILHITFFFTYYTVRAPTLQNDVTWCYEKT